MACRQDETEHYFAGRDVMPRAVRLRVLSLPIAVSNNFYLVTCDFGYELEFLLVS